MLELLPRDCCESDVVGDVAPAAWEPSNSEVRCGEPAAHCDDPHRSHDAHTHCADAWMCAPCAISKKLALLSPVGLSEAAPLLSAHPVGFRKEGFHLTLSARARLLSRSNRYVHSARKRCPLQRLNSDALRQAPARHGQHERSTGKAPTEGHQAVYYPERTSG